MMNPRRADRVVPDGLSCQLGDILDLSETGLRIRSVGRPRVEVGSQLTLTIASALQKLSVKGQIVWVRKSLLGGMVGVRFVDTPPALAAALVELANHGFVELPPTGSTCSSSATSKPKASGSGSGFGGTGEGSSSVRAEVHVENYYEALGVLPSATTEELHAAYRVLARQLHPDVNPSPDAAQRFAYVARAYAVLKDPAKRLRHDEARRATRDRAA